MSLVNYEQLKQHYDSVKPIRGTTIKPFQQRRRKHEHMVMRDNGDIQLICYNTPVLTVHPDSSFSVCHGGWVTPTTSCFIDFVVRVMSWREPLAGSFKYKNQLWLSQWKDGRPVMRDGREDHWERMPITKEPIRYVFNPETQLYNPATNPVVTKVRIRTDKERWAQTKKDCREFLVWLNAFGKLLDGEFIPSENRRWQHEVRWFVWTPVYLKDAEERGGLAQQVKEDVRNILLGDDTEKYTQLLCNMPYNAHAPFDFKKSRPKIMHLMKCAFDVYNHVNVEVEYRFTRNTKW